MKFQLKTYFVSNSKNVIWSSIRTKDECGSIKWNTLIFSFNFFEIIFFCYFVLGVNLKSKQWKTYSSVFRAKNSLKSICNHWIFLKSTSRRSPYAANCVIIIIIDLIKFTIYLGMCQKCQTEMPTIYTQSCASVNKQSILMAN